jgi:hypothetical protein
MLTRDDAIGLINAYIPEVREYPLPNQVTYL